ncbi:MAG: bifunctional pyr operon transcriptional regulator/uracil phosphoribosyltransferase PyrR [Chitinophagales bacterium]|nr:bifunctional pyr operon transcriptional regulator/uracil phosphoribosyltransferase PyrR [Chitinophagales bacterium]
MHPRIILASPQFRLTIHRLCHLLIENHQEFKDTVLIGVQPRGVWLSERILRVLKEITGIETLQHGKLDITFYRDDFRQKGKPLLASETQIPFSIEGKKVVLIDDVLFTGRTIRAALDAILDFGRPELVELLVLIDRRLHRDFPIQANYVGRVVDSIAHERVRVEWQEEGGSDTVWIEDHD